MRERGLSPSLAVSFSGNSAFSMAQASGSAFLSTSCFSLCLSVQFESFPCFFLVLPPLYKDIKHQLHKSFPNAFFWKRHFETHTLGFSNSVFRVSNSVFRIENEKRRGKKQGGEREKTIFFPFSPELCSSFPSSDREPKVRNSMRDFVLPCFNTVLVFTLVFFFF